MPSPLKIGAVVFGAWVYIVVGLGFSMAFESHVRRTCASPQTFKSFLIQFGWPIIIPAAFIAVEIDDTPSEKPCGGQ